MKETAGTTEALERLRDAEMTPGICYICPFTCPTEVYTRRGEVVYVRGNTRASTKGSRCVKGEASHVLANDDNRLKHPMRRVGPNRFERVTWDEALTQIARKLTDIKAKYGPGATNVGDEGGYAPPIEMTGDALEAILQAISDAGYDESIVRVGIDAASSSFYNGKDSTYQIDGKKLTGGELEDYYEELVKTYPIRTLEDPFDEDDFDSFAQITQKLGNRVKIIGDDLYVTNPERIKRGVQKKATNAILIKLNQIGTVTETLDAIKMSKEAGLDIVVSHRSGETEDTFISHLATSQESLFIKTGAPARGERTAKYNELLRIEEELGSSALFMGSTLK